MSLLRSPIRPAPSGPVDPTQTDASAEPGQGRTVRQTTRPPNRPTNHPPAVAVVVLSVALAALLLFHTAVPDVAGLGLLIDSVIPWFGVFIPVLVVLALASRRPRALVAVLVPAVVWALLFVPAVVPLSWTTQGGAGATTAGSGSATGSSTTAGSGSATGSSTTAATRLTVASQNIEASSGTGDISARALAATGADVIALEEMTSADFDSISGTLATDYPYSYGVGTVGLWSRYPVVNAQPLNLGLGWNRALAADLETPQGLVSIYVIHAASARPGEVSARDSMLSALAETLPNDENDRVIAVGDFNAASTDRAMSGILGQLAEPNQTGGMFGNTWPSNLPVTRLDHLLQRGMTVASNTTLSVGASDHRAILTTLNL